MDHHGYLTVTSYQKEFVGGFTIEGKDRRFLEKQQGKEEAMKLCKLLKEYLHPYLWDEFFELMQRDDGDVQV